MANKLCQHDWQIENEDEIIDRFVDDETEYIKRSVKFALKRKKVLDCSLIFLMFNDFKEAQYAEYLDTPEFDHMKEGCRGHEEDR